MDTNSIKLNGYSNAETMETPKPLTFNGLVRADLKDYCKAANMKFNEHVRSLMAQGQQIYHFGFGQAPFPILEHMAEALKDSVTEATYLPVAGRSTIITYKKLYNSYTWYSIKINELLILFFGWGGGHLWCWLVPIW